MEGLSLFLGSLLLFLNFPGFTLATTASLCATFNTGSSFQAVQNNYQSNGACTTTCAGYAFGIVQYDQCWCSNIAPGSTVSLSQCNEDCPGYPIEKCGNSDNGVFGYIVIGNRVAGTAGGSSPSPSSTAQAASSSSPPKIVTSMATVVQVSSAVVVSVSSVFVTPSPVVVSSSSPVATTPSSTWTPTPSASVMTVSGSVRTVVVTPSSPPQATTTIVAGSSSADNTGAASTSTGFFSNKGAVAGVFTVVGLLAAALIGLGAWFFIWRRKMAQEGSERLNSFEEERGSRPPTFMSRRTSELGLKTTDLGAGVTRGSDEKTPTGSHMTPGTLSRRTSIPLTDSRLNAAVMFHDNGSHMSVQSLQDNQDYSRPVLQVANPDRPGSSAIEDD